MQPPRIFTSNNLYNWRCARQNILLALKSDRDTIAIAFDCQQAVVAGEPADSDGYPADDITYPPVAAADPAVPAAPRIGVLNRISTRKNNKAFKILIDHVSDPIQQAIHANTDMATRAFRFLDSLYSEEGSRLEHTTLTALLAWSTYDFH